MWSLNAKRQSKVTPRDNFVRERYQVTRDIYARYGRKFSHTTIAVPKTIVSDLLLFKAKLLCCDKANSAVIEDMTQV